MKSTGIVRRIDDLGRVIVPKEIRRTLRIREGDPFEIFVDGEAVVFKKYSELGSIPDCVNQYVNALYRSTMCAAIVTDTERVIAVSGASKKDFLEKEISTYVEDIIQSKQPSCNTKEMTKIPIVLEDRYSYVHQIIYPIVNDGTAIGSVILLETDSERETDHSLYDIAKTASFFFSKMID